MTDTNVQSAPAVTLAQAAEDWMDQRGYPGEARYRDRQVETRGLEALLRLAGHRAAGDLDRETLRRWRRHLDTLDISRRVGALRTVHAFCRWLVVEGILAADPFVEAGEANTLDPFIARYVAEQKALGVLSRDTALRRSYNLSRFSRTFGRRPLDQLTVRAVERWLGELSYLAPRTRRLHLSQLKTFLRWMVDHGHIDRDPARTIKVRNPRAVPRALTGDQVRQVLVAIGDNRTRVIITLMLYCGLRCCEVARLRLEDYDPRAGTLLVVGKGNHERVLPVPDAARTVLDTYRDSVPGSTGPLIRSLADPRCGLTPASVSRLVGRAMAAAGVKGARFDGVSAHALRHTAASDVLDTSHDLRAVQEMLGHQSLSTTQVYLRRAGLGRLREAMDGRDYSGGAA